MKPKPRRQGGKKAITATTQHGAERSLTPKQIAFAAEYIKDFNSTQAALRSGYSEKSAHMAGYNALRNPEVSRVISENLKQRALEADVTVEWVIARLREEATSEADDASAATRVAALDKLAKITGAYERDNAQRQGFADLRPTMIRLVPLKPIEEIEDAEVIED